MTIWRPRLRGGRAPRKLKKRMAMYFGHLVKKRGEFFWRWPKRVMPIEVHVQKDRWPGSIRFDEEGRAWTVPDGEMIIDDPLCPP